MGETGRGDMGETGRGGVAEGMTERVWWGHSNSTVHRSMCSC